MSFLDRLRRAGSRDLRLAVEAMMVLTVADLLVRLAPSRIIARTLGRRGSNVHDDALPSHHWETAESVSRAVRRAARYHPLRPVCLPQALAARTMLRRRRVPTILSLGVARDEEGRLMAHAWLRAGAIIVTGGDESPPYTPVQHFS